MLIYKPALPHCLKEDDIQDGYLIPKGSVIIPNVWLVRILHALRIVSLSILPDRNMLHDPEIYGKPMEFNPSRFLGDHPERDPTDFCFGFGRRYTCNHHRFSLNIDDIQCSTSDLLESAQVRQRWNCDFLINRLVGLMLAQASIFVACAKSLAAFNITTSKDADGVSIVPQQDFTSGIIR